MNTFYLSEHSIIYSYQTRTSPTLMPKIMYGGISHHQRELAGVHDHQQLVHNADIHQQIWWAQFFLFFLNERDRSTGWSNSQNPHLLLVGFYYDWYIQDWMGHRNCYMHVPLISFDCAITIFIWSHQSIFWSLSWDWLCNYTRYEWKYMDFFFFLPILAKNHWFSRKTFAFKIDNELWSLIIANVQSQNKDWSSR